jgi:hypothetical protein
VEVDYLNLLLLTKGRNTIESYFDANGEACIQPNALRIHGKFTESTDWSTSATTTPNNTPNKKPKIELLTDF